MSGQRWSERVVRRRGRVALGWAAAVLALAPFASRVEEVLDVSSRIQGSESAAVEEALAVRFGSPFTRAAALVVTGVPSPDDERGAEVLRRVVAALRSEPEVARIYSYLDDGDPAFLPASHQGTYVLVGLGPDLGNLDARLVRLRARTEALATELRREQPPLALRWTGEPFLNQELRHSSTEAVRSAERRALPLTLALLLLAFGALAASLLPVVVGSLAIVSTLGLAALLARLVPLSLTLQSIVSMLGLGLGIDYALLVVSRFREALAEGGAPEEAAAEATRHAGHTVLVSATAVAIGFLGLLLLPVSELRSVALGGLVVVALAAALSVTLLPGLLAWLGPRVERGRLRRPDSGAGRDRWRRWALGVAARPVAVTLLCGVPVGLLALQSGRMKTGLPAGDWLPPDMPSAAALRDLRAMGAEGLVQSIRVLVTLPAGENAWEEPGWNAVRNLSRSLAEDTRIARVRSLPGLLGGRPDGYLLAGAVPADVKRAFVSREGDQALVEVVPREGVGPDAIEGLVRRLRAADARALTGLRGSRLLVGGLPAANADYDDAVAGRLPRVILMVVGGTVLALGLVFRSVVVPLKAVALNLLSVLAALGAVVLVFQEGRGAGLVGHAATGAVLPAVPALVFCIVFGLSMDYEVFLVARVAEARRSGRDELSALAEGVAQTAGVITSAAAVMIAVFGAFAAGGFLLIQMLGFALAVAIALDAVVIRMGLGPALLRLAGRWNWWPALHSSVQGR